MEDEAVVEENNIFIERNFVAFAVRIMIANLNIVP